LHVSDPPL